MNPLRTLTCVTLGALACMAGTGHANPIPFPVNNGCEWHPQRPAGPSTLTYALGDFHTTMDAAVGSVLVDRPSVFPIANQQSFLGCATNVLNQPRVPIEFTTTNLMPPARVLPDVKAVGLPFPAETIFETNIPGVGASLLMQSPYAGHKDSDLAPAGEPRIPFTSHSQGRIRINFLDGTPRITVTLVKTGPIPAGTHVLTPDTLLAKASIDDTRPYVKDAYFFGLSGTLTVSGCNAAQDPVTPNPVNLGSFDAGDFSRASSRTEPVRFDLNLTDCQRPITAALPRIKVRFDPANGSPLLDAAQGLFGLNGNSEGGGVAVQLLRGDGTTPMPLQVDEPVQELQNGEAQLPFNARLVRHSASGPVKPGKLEASLGFLVTYD